MEPRPPKPIPPPNRVVKDFDGLDGVLLGLLGLLYGAAALAFLLWVLS